MPTCPLCCDNTEEFQVMDDAWRAEVVGQKNPDILFPAAFASLPSLSLPHVAVGMPRIPPGADSDPTAQGGL